ncbi:MAG: insulinase family protein [Desulfovibrionaceae bacterium]|nr:insulinase family protein [Desulfovibrionaceae bacterium]
MPAAQRLRKILGIVAPGVLSYVISRRKDMLEHYELIFERQIPELRSRARFWLHRESGAQLLSLCNQDENKVFGVTLRTPPADSTGLPHILEHSVLCGSDKYPVREPFVELLKGSLQTFLNAFTYPDKTCYPVASANLQDFYNLTDVYLDAVFHPRLGEDVFQQEGWHVEVERAGGEPRYSFKGVVYNEMKGAFSSPESVLGRQILHSLFPDVPYGLESGGDPEEIPKLDFTAFTAFHRRYYHPSNARFFFWGDDPEEKRLEIIQELAGGYTRLPAASSPLPLQNRFTAPRCLRLPYSSGEGDQAIFTLNWMLEENGPAPEQIELALGLRMLEHTLIGMPASPLRRALLESGLGDDLAGSGLENELRQSIFSIGLKGIREERAGEAEKLILGVLEDLAGRGIPSSSVEAAINSVEFELRENNTGRFPVGLAVMLRSLALWLYSDDPADEASVAALRFEAPLEAIKGKAASGYFEALIKKHFLDNPHRSTVLLYPDPDLGRRRNKEEEDRLYALLEIMGPTGKEALAEQADHLKRLQEKPDAPENLARIPRLRLGDLPAEGREIPQLRPERPPVPVYLHPQPTGGVCYLDLHLDPAGLPDSSLVLLPMLGRAMLEMGNRDKDYVTLNMEIARKTGGMETDLNVMGRMDDRRPLLSLGLRGKATTAQAEALFALSAELLTRTDLDNQAQFSRMLLEEKARLEHRLIPSGHQVIAGRIRASLSLCGSLDEKISGLAYLEEVRALSTLASANWPVLLGRLQEARALILKRDRLRLSLTAEEEVLPRLLELAGKLAGELSSSPSPTEDPDGRSFSPSSNLPKREALLVPAQVNYVGKGVNLYDHGYAWHGSALVILKYLRTGWLWEKIRVQGGAYGVICGLDRATGDFCLASYRDPDIRHTLRCFDECADQLITAPPDRRTLETAIIGAIGELDAYLLPEARGRAAYHRAICLDTPEQRARLRAEAMAASTQDFTAFGEILARALPRSVSVALGGANLETFALEEGWTINRVL